MRGKTLWSGVGAAMLVAACSDDRPGSGLLPPRVLKCAEARIASSADLLPGPLARGAPGDLVIENDKLRVIVQKGGRNWYNISQFGGNIIDALPKAADGRLLGADHFEEFVLGTNIESAPNYQSVTVLNRGGARADGSCEPAVIRAEGPDDLLDFVNGSSAIRGLSLQGLPLNFPPSADDVDLPVRIQTDYTLEAGRTYVKVETRLINESDPAQDVDIYLVEYMNGSGEVEVFQHGYGFGEAFATAPCDRCNYVAYAGHEGGAGVSYGLIHQEPGSSSVSVSGVTVFLYGRDIVTVALTPEDLQADHPETAPNYTVPAGGELAITRYFAVGDGTVASIVDARNTIHGLETGAVQGVVREAGSGAPVAGAEVVMVSSGRDGFPAEHGPVHNVVNHFRTDAQGRFKGTYPAGTYTLEVNVPGRAAAEPATRSVNIAAGETTESQDFTVPPPSFLQVRVRDAGNVPIAAKVQLLGAPSGPDGNEPRNRDCFGVPQGGCALGQNPLGIRTGFFGDPAADPLPPGIALAEFAVTHSAGGPATVGDTGLLAIEPGTYTLSVSHGPRYNAVQKEVTITAGQTTVETVQLVEALPTPGYVHADFHVHSISSPDSEVTHRERVATYLAEGMDFFTPSDHDTRVDFAPVVSAMGVGDRIATAPSAEVTTFDYGHFNFWPVAIETDRPCDDFIARFMGDCETSGHSAAAKISRGATDWGGQAPLGKDFPQHGHFSLSPAEIFASAGQDPFAPGRQVVRQINHIDNHFGNKGGSGLGIDTAAAGGPASTVDPASRRLDPATANHYGMDYHTLEILIGTDGTDYQNVILYQENMGDWFNLLNLGAAKVGISNSDTHTRRVTSMHTRNQISVPPALLAGGRANFAAIAADPHEVGDSVIAGLTTMTNAPWLEVTVSEGANTATLRSGRSFGGIANPLPTDGEATLDIAVKSPLWAPYDQILVFVNGETERHTDNFGQPTATPRYRICGPGAARTFTLGATGESGFTREEVEAVAGNPASAHYATTKQVTISHPDTDFWIVVMVRGTTGNSPTMWPVVPNNFVANSNANAAAGVRALAISNPLYVDVNGGGWSAPGPRVHSGSRLPPDTCPQAMPAP